MILSYETIAAAPKFGNVDRHNATALKHYVSIDMHIQIAGGIATGKSSLAKLLAADLGLDLVSENFLENPFWRLFYSEPSRYEFEKNASFLLTHGAQLKQIFGVKPVICDFCLLQDLAYSRLSSSKEHIKVCRLVYNYIVQMVEQPAVIVVVSCGEEQQVRRIFNRAIPEESRLERSYLRSLNFEISRVLKGVHHKMIQRFDNSSEPFDVRGEAYSRLIQNIRESLRI
jgi:deoxyadenosine/deoxycytidine kinase